MAELHFTSWLREIVPDGPLSAAGALRDFAAARRVNVGVGGGPASGAAADRTGFTGTVPG